MIKVSDLYFEYPVADGPNLRILDGVSLDLNDGERIGLMGPNGSGKTTFARCLNGLLRPSSGSVEVDGFSTAGEEQAAEVRRRVGMVFQNPENQIVATTVEREIAFGLENLGMPREQMHQVVAATLRKFDLMQYRETPPHLLSGGEMQRLALAAVMAMSPQTIIFDEPSSFLDGKSRKELLAQLGDLHSERVEGRKRTTVFITQHPEEVLPCDRLLILDKGKIVIDGRPQDVFLQVKRLRAMGIDVPIEFAVNDYLGSVSGDQSSLNPSDFLPII